MKRDPYQQALKKYRLAQRLRDPRKLIAAFHYYHENLTPGEWVILKPPRREESRELNHGWPDALTAAKRILHLASRWTTDTDGKPALRFYVRGDVWGLVQSRLGLVASVGPAGSDSTSPERLKRERAEREFEAALFSQAIERAFRTLPTGWTMTKQLEELSAELGPLFLERAQAYLTRDYDRLGLPPPPAAPAPKVKPPAPPPSEVTVSQFAKAFLNKAQYSSEW